MLSNRIISHIMFLFMFIFTIYGFSISAQENTIPPYTPSLTIDPLGGRVRDLPSSDGEVIETLRGDIVPIIATNTAQNYYLITFNGQLGWIGALFGKTDADPQQLPIVDDIPLDTFPTVTLPDQTSAFVRPDARLTAPADISGQSASVIGLLEDGSFYLIVTNDLTLWLPSDQLQVESPTITYTTMGDDAPLLTVGAMGAVMRAAPNTDGERIATIPQAKLPIMGISPDGSYYWVVFEGQIGWVSGSLSGADGDLSLLPIIEAVTPTACIISTDQPRTVLVRVGYGENRTSITTLEADSEFEAVGKNEDDEANTWYALNKEEAAPSKSVSGDVVWVASQQVDTSGSCNSLPLIDASGIIPIVNQPATDTGTTAPTQGNTQTVSVPGSAAWFNSGINVIASSTLTFSASGSVRTAPVEEYADAVGGPDGQPYACPGPVNDATCTLNNVNYGALLGRVGTNGRPFLIGSSRTVTASSDGQLYFAINDNSGFHADNSGSYTVTVTIQP